MHLLLVLVYGEVLVLMRVAFISRFKSNYSN